MRAIFNTMKRVLVKIICLMSSFSIGLRPKKYNKEYPIFPFFFEKVMGCFSTIGHFPLRCIVNYSRWYGILWIISCSFPALYFSVLLILIKVNLSSYVYFVSKTGKTSHCQSPQSKDAIGVVLNKKKARLNNYICISLRVIWVGQML